MRLFRGLLGYWETALGRRRLAIQLDRFHAAADAAGELRLAEAIGLVHDAWDEGRVDQVLELLHRDRRQHRDDQARKRRKVS